MGKGKGKGRKIDKDADVDSDSSTVVGAREGVGKNDKKKGKGKAAVSESDSDEGESVSNLESYLDQLTEKRVATRTGALKSIIELLRGQVSEEAHDCAATLVESLLGSIKKGSSTEAYLAATALSLSFITLAEDNSNLLEDALPVLGAQLKTNKHAGVRAACAEVIGIAVISVGEDVSETVAIMTRLAKYFPEPKDVSVSCIKAWGLLASSLSDGALVVRMEELLYAMGSLHDSADMEVRVAAAENVALLFEACWRYGGDAVERFCTEREEEGEEEEGSSEGGEGQAQGGQSVRRVKKADRLYEKTVMRRAMKTMEGGAAAPVEKIRVKGVTLTMDTWRDKKRLAALRGVLQGGFQTHMVWNELLHDIFSFDPSQAQSADVGGTGVGQGTKKLARQASFSRHEKERKKVVDKGRSEKESGQCIDDGFSD